MERGKYVLHGRNILFIPYMRRIPVLIHKLPLRNRCGRHGVYLEGNHCYVDGYRRYRKFPLKSGLYFPARIDVSKGDPRPYKGETKYKLIKDLVNGEDIEPDYLFFKQGTLTLCFGRFLGYEPDTFYNEPGYLSCETDTFGLVGHRSDMVRVYSKAFAESINFESYSKPDIPLKSRFFLTDRDLLEDWAMVRCIELGINYEGLHECYS